MILKREKVKISALLEVWAEKTCLKRNGQAFKELEIIGLVSGSKENCTLTEKGVLILSAILVELDKDVYLCESIEIKLNE